MIFLLEAFKTQKELEVLGCHPKAVELTPLWNLDSQNMLSVV